jgi:aldehyde dehydrogenase (NAD+)
MAVTQAIPMTRHPYADGSYKKMLIDGKWVDAASGKKFETHNPATGELLATVAEGDVEDINRAVAAARRAFEGPWSKVKPFERQALLLKLADLVEKNFEELSQLDTLDMGAPISRTRGNKLRAVGMLRYYAGQTTAIHGETIENSLPGEIFSYTLKEPIGVVGAIIPWNGPLTATIWKIGPAIATGCTVVLKPAEEAPLTSLRIAGLRWRRHSTRRRQRRARLWRDRGRCARLAPRRRQGRLHRLACHGTVDHPRLGRQPQARLARARRQVAGHRVRGCRSRCRVPARGDGGVRQFRPDLQRRARGCSSSSKIYDEFVGRVAEFGKKLQSATGLDPNTQIGPLVSAEQMKRVSGYLSIGQQEGAKALTGGSAADRRRAVERAISCADGVRQRAGQYADRAGGNLRTGHIGDLLQGYRRPDRARQRHDVWIGQRRLDHQCQQGAPGRKSRCAPARSG